MSAVALMASTAVRRIEPEWRRTLSPVHAGSRHAHEFVATPINRRERGQRIRALAFMARRLRQPGKVRTAITWVDEKVLAHLMELAVRFRGEVFPSTAAIARAVGCGLSTVNRARKRLKALGWLDWTRRCEPTGEAGTRGPQVRQISNAYALRLPPAAAALIADWNKVRATKAWTDDEGQANAAAREGMRRADTKLGEILESWGLTVSERESRAGRESPI